MSLENYSNTTQIDDDFFVCACAPKKEESFTTIVIHPNITYSL